MSAANVAACYTWSNRVERKRPQPTLDAQGVGSFAEMCRGSKCDQCCQLAFLAQQKRRKRIRRICFTGSGDCFVRPHRLFLTGKVSDMFDIYDYSGSGKVRLDWESELCVELGLKLI